MKSLVVVVAVIVLVGCTTWVFKTSRANTETAPYTVVRKDQDVEVRDYPRLQLASTGMAGKDKNGSFMRLFRYITGDNERSEAIAMTTPVLIDRNPASPGMSFVVPQATQAKGAPQPKSGQVQVKELPAARFAVLRFKGADNPVAEAAAFERLKAWCTAQKLSVDSEPLFAYYDPPWTPGFMRRNEVLLRVRP